tara:strand:+ start:199 stop:843 length:645 start_codon:yes stop_codon:yes gene_type:complete
LKNNQLKTFIWGGKSKLRILIPYLAAIGRKPDYVFDPYLENLDFEIEGKHFNNEKDISRFASICDSFVVTIGGQNGYERYKIAELLKEEYNLKPINMINKTSYICPTAIYGEGLMMMPGSVLHSYSRVGNQCIINTNASIDHECEVGNGVHIMGGAVVTGRVKIKDFATVGSNSVILPDIELGEGSMIGAGAVVTKNVRKGETVLGVPARKYEK